MKKRLSLITIALGILFNTEVLAQYPSFADLVEKLIPSVVNISTTITKDETDSDFIETIKNLKEIEFSKIHTFPYSIRSNTEAANMKQVNDKRNLLCSNI